MAERALELRRDYYLRQRLIEGVRKFVDGRTARRVTEQIVAICD